MRLHSPCRCLAVDLQPSDPKLSSDNASNSHHLIPHHVLLASTTPTEQAIELWQSPLAFVRSAVLDSDVCPRLSKSRMTAGPMLNAKMDFVALITTIQSRLCNYCAWTQCSMTTSSVSISSLSRTCSCFSRLISFSQSSPFS